VTSAETELKRLDKLIFAIDDIDTVVETGVHAETLALMYARAYEALRGITESLSSQMSHVFSQSLLEGVSVATIAARLTEEISKASKVRADSLSRTEVIRTYNESKLNIFEQNRITRVSTDLEFLTAGDSRVCPICAALAGKRFTIAEARGVIPLHLRCRCSFIVATEEEQDAA
jgi:SPP1 gp7 family putative phage head morphogenesis protein